MLKVMLVDNNIKRSTQLKLELQNNRCQVVAVLEHTLNLNQTVATVQPDVIIIGTESPERDTLEHICLVSQDTPKPIVMFTHDGDSEKIREAIRSGVSAYVVGKVDTERLKPIIDAAIARFETYQELRNELKTTQAKLAERKLIDKAKGILMKQRQISEDDAYKLMRTVAMNEGKKIAVIASQIIDASKWLL